MRDNQNVYFYFASFGLNCLLLGGTTTLDMHHAFLNISLASLHEYDVKMTNFTFCGRREHKATTFFLFFRASIQSFRIQLQEKLPRFDELNEMNERDKV